jgi:hypothetical protein
MVATRASIDSAFSPFEQIANEHEVGLEGLFDVAFAIRQRIIDIGAAAKLNSKEHIYRVIELLSQIQHGSVEADKPRVDGGNRCQNSSKD